MNFKELILNKTNKRKSDYEILMESLQTEYESQKEKDKTGSYHARVIYQSGYSDRKVPYLSYDYMSEVNMNEVRECFRDFPDGVFVFINSSNEIYVYLGENYDLLKMGDIEPPANIQKPVLIKIMNSIDAFAEYPFIEFNREEIPLLEISVVIGNYNEADTLFRIVALEDLERGQSYGPMTPEELMQNEKFKFIPYTFYK